MLAQQSGVHYWLVWSCGDEGASTWESEQQFETYLSRCAELPVWIGDLFVVDGCASCTPYQGKAEYRDHPRAIQYGDNGKSYIQDNWQAVGEFADA